MSGGQEAPETRLRSTVATTVGVSSLDATVSSEPLSQRLRNTLEHTLHDARRIGHEHTFTLRENVEVLPNESGRFYFAYDFKPLGSGDGPIVTGAYRGIDRGCVVIEQNQGRVAYHLPIKLIKDFSPVDGIGGI